MVGSIALFVDRRLAFWLSAVYFNASLNAGSEEVDAIDGCGAVFDAIQDEMDFEEEMHYWDKN